MDRRGTPRPAATAPRPAAPAPGRETGRPRGRRDRDAPWRRASLPGSRGWRRARFEQSRRRSRTWFLALRQMDRAPIAKLAIDEAELVRHAIDRVGRAD